MEMKLRTIIDGFKIQASDFLKSNKKAFIKDITNNYYFCEILQVTESFIYIKCFEGQKKDKEKLLYFADIVNFEEYKSKKK